MSIFQANISLLNKFLKQFASCFSKKQMAMFTLLIYALFKDDKRNSIDAMAKATHTDYQKLPYFFTSSQMLNGIFKLSNTRDFKSFKSKEPRLPQKTGFLPLMTQDAQSHSQKRPKAQNGNTAALSNEKKSVMSVSALLSSHNRSISPST